MGMFDSFWITCKCPYCSETSKIEFQTKDFECGLMKWNEGEPFNSSSVDMKEGVIKDTYGDCMSKRCLKQRAKELGYESGFGMLFYADVIIKKGLVKGIQNIRKE